MLAMNIKRYSPLGHHQNNLSIQQDITVSRLRREDSGEMKFLVIFKQWLSEGKLSWIWSNVKTEKRVLSTLEWGSTFPKHELPELIWVVFLQNWSGTFLNNVNFSEKFITYLRLVWFTIEDQRPLLRSLFQVSICWASWNVYHWTQSSDFNRRFRCIQSFYRHLDWIVAWTAINWFQRYWFQKCWEILRIKHIS